MDVHFVTNLGDQAVIIPLMLAVGLVLMLAGWWRGAAAWFLVVPATLGAVLFAKMSTKACQGLIPPVELYSPSGHTAAAAIVYGGVLALALGGRFLVPALCAASVALAVGLTRVALNVHTVADVIAGGLLGTAGVVVLAHLAGPRPALRRGWAMVAAAMLLVVGTFHGRHVYAEGAIGDLARSIWPFRICIDLGLGL